MKRLGKIKGPARHGNPWTGFFPFCVCLTVFFVSASVSIAQQAQDSADSPPNPLRLGEKELQSGNPLAGYVKLLELESVYRKAGQEGLFFDAKANRQASLGDTAGALVSWAKLRRKRPGGTQTASPLDKYTPADAVAVIVKKAGRHNVIMLGEEHVQPQTRTILKPLLQQLWQRGFRYFAAETFKRDLTSTIKLGYATYDTGAYTRDPVFAEAVTEAIRLGYELVPYEQIEPPTENKPGDPLFRQNWREFVQARNLKTRIFDKNPTAKVLVWAGRAHVSEEAGEVPGVGTLKPMGFQFTELTGIDPFTVYLPAGAEQATPEYEFNFYRYATRKGWVDRPTIFTKPNGDMFAVGGDAMVFFPRVTIESGRPDWLARELDRVRVEIPSALLVKKRLQLVQAFHVKDFERAIPLDQILIERGGSIPVLMLPKGRSYWVRCIDETGEIHGPVEVNVP